MVDLARLDEPAEPVIRTDGFLALRDYAVIGDGRTAALVGRDGAVDWLALPNLDSSTVFAAVLDAGQGGRFALQPAVPFRVSRRYLPGTNVLETTFVTDAGVVRVTDALTVYDDAVLCPLRELQRRIDALSGSVPMSWAVQPRFGYGSQSPRLAWRAGVAIAAHGSAAVGVCSFDAGQPTLGTATVTGRFTASEGKEALLVMTFADQEPLILPSRTECDARLAATVAAWREWTMRRDAPERWRDAVLRSALAIKLLVFAPSGAIAAAATSSLPECVGGERNWDYRYSWIRDSVFTLDAFLRLGCIAEARSYYWWLMHASQLTYPRLRVLYRLDGGVRTRERTLPLGGYRGSRPVRVGNGAADQLQLDSYGELLATSSLYADAAGELDTDVARRLARVADFVCASWHHPDAGIWEVRSGRRHFTHSKMMCWVALDRAARLAERGLIPRKRLTHWRSTQARIRQFVHSECVSRRGGYYTRAAGSDELDAATLLGLLEGYCDGTDPVMRATVEAVGARLRTGPYVHRYQGEDGLHGFEGAFLPCSFWLAEALARTGRIEEAVTLMDELVGLANDVGLYSEEVDPGSGAFLGNMPQALTHLALINAACTIAARAETAAR
ncbi:MAG: glycoside hydrolase family 15 protein [Mycobacterium sp.]|uniref:glycoside hydrolase family 15 protein n=1 Tax=Mycobacterium sp. TaxID=1785 RepID=UPI00260EFA7F|nr:glycoside hydrolase family 15 protein [Mycobacterium sp.]MDI3315184.1 glycoside hydrolase family 15 protein [Mycobacterium sp.]